MERNYFAPTQEDYAKRLERIEELKAKERQGTRNDLTSEKNFAKVNRTTDIVAEKLDIGCSFLRG